MTSTSVVQSVKVTEQHVARLHSLGGLDVPEKFKVPHRELGGHLHGAELQQGDLTLSQKVLSVVVRAQRLRFHVILQVVPADRHTHTLHLRVRSSRHLQASPSAPVSNTSKPKSAAMRRAAATSGEGGSPHHLLWMLLLTG